MSHGVTKVGPCQNCHRTLTLQTEKLCKACWSIPAVKKKFPPSKASAGQRGRVKDFYGGNHHAEAATTTGPGTKAKLDVLAERAMAGVALAHPLDAADLDGVVPTDLLAYREEGGFKPNKVREVEEE